MDASKTKKIAVTAKTVFTLTCCEPKTPETLIPVVIIAESGDKASELLRSKYPDVEIISSVSAQELAMLLGVMREAASGGIKPFIVQDGYSFAEIF